MKHYRKTFNTHGSSQYQINSEKVFFFFLQIAGQGAFALLATNKT